MAKIEAKYGATIVGGRKMPNGTTVAIIGWPEHVPLVIGNAILFDLFPPTERDEPIIPK